jgi:hypothetical protein
VGVAFRTESTIYATMRRSLVERSLSDVHGRLRKARQELAVLDEQLLVMIDIADDLRLRSLVSETPLAAQEHGEAQRHLEAAQRARTALAETIAELERKQDELLERLTF